MTDQYYQQQGNSAYPQHYQGGPHYPQPPQSKALGIASMVIGIVAIVLGFIPLIGLLSFILGPAAIVLGILALANKTGQAQAITGIVTGALGLITVSIGTWLFGAAMSSFEEETTGSVTQTVEPEGPEESEESEVNTEEPADVEDEQAAGDESEPTETDEVGTRANPLAIGETVSNRDWEVTVNSVTRDAGDQIAGENQFNDPAPEGTTYALINVSISYSGDASQTPLFGTGIAYVSGTGETIDEFDQYVVVPDPLDSMRELYNGGTEQGNVAIAIPNDDEDGAVRIRLGFVSTEDYFFKTE
ncbi:hypothetical protein LTI14_10885 [Nesterenkonia sp. YGD6]|uniref:DUF4190 domain-containing protein n=1 Tax=Nesterenkonia sp. YGD6 TaxID=2901231 RepID=UPI001F4CF080|nr:DUF4190 domain-containing protein [Nesterenkonia sp. YGD6]MCH8563711.1 hypothetical protein [Nesterenkonia sp. YGD6]